MSASYLSCWVRVELWQPIAQEDGVDAAEEDAVHRADPILRGSWVGGGELPGGTVQGAAHFHASSISTSCRFT